MKASVQKLRRTNTSPSINEILAKLYMDVDRQVKQLTQSLKGRLNCRKGCSDCCVDDISVSHIEADNIRFHYADLLKNDTAHPAGACAFLDEQGACRIYDARPYVCRTQGLPLHWLEQIEDGQTVAMRDICQKNDAGIPVEQLPLEDCWIIGPTEEALAKLQFAAYRESSVRIRLRDLFPR